MKPATAKFLLRAVLIVSAAVILSIVFYGVPQFMAHVTHVRPSLQPWAIPMEAYGAALAAPILTVIVMLWRMFDTLAGDSAFTLENVRRYRRMAWLALVDLALVVALAVFLIISGVMPAFIAVCLLAAAYIDTVGTIVFFVLGGLLHNAVELKQDHDLTI